MSSVPRDPVRYRLSMPSGGRRATQRTMRAWCGLDEQCNLQSPEHRHEDGTAVQPQSHVDICLDLPCSLPDRDNSGLVSELCQIARVSVGIPIRSAQNQPTARRHKGTRLDDKVAKL